jgi:membrane-associated protease RseP (regulator of RpoE activity)
MPDNPSPPLEYQIFDPERQEIRVVLVPPPKNRYWLHALLFLATLLSTLCIGARLQDDFNRNVWPYSDDDNFLPWSWALQDWHRLALGWPFAACLLGILTAHELGHYILCTRRGVQATLPFFIPFPSLIGTLGAVIRIKSPIRSRKDLFDIGIAGPIAGFVVAVPILFASLLASKPIIPQDNSWPVLGFPLIFHLAHWVLAALGSSAAGAQLNPGQLYLPPTAVAAWVGMLATALNLLPGGQLDGGHIIFALNPRAHQWVSRFCILMLLLFSWFFWAGWLVWAILLRITGSRHPIVPTHPGLERKSRTLAVLAALMLLVTLTPAPTAGSTLPQAIHEIQKQIREYRQHR